MAVPRTPSTAPRELDLPVTEYVHPETGEVLATEQDWREALAAVEERMAPLYRLRRQLREQAAERFQAAEQPSRWRDRTDIQRRVERCPRCGGKLESEEAP